MQSICPGQYLFGNKSINLPTLISFGMQDKFKFLPPVSGKALTCCRLGALHGNLYL
jgi:hypothetical protein